ILRVATLLISADEVINGCETVEGESVAGIQLTCALQIVHRIGPASLPTVNQCRKIKNLRVIGQGAPGNSKLGEGTVVIEVAPVAVHSQGKVRLSRVRFQPKS